MMNGLFLVSCASVDLPDVCPEITLPASGDGYCRTTVTHKARRIPKAQWDIEKKKRVHVSFQDWTKIKKEFLKHCVMNKCKQAVGAFDDLFLSLDKALKKVTID